MKRHLFLFILFVLPFSTIYARQWDRQMKLVQCNMKVSADIFTATTFIEMEFYNDSNSELEGLYRFQLLPSQVITAFQLDLNGKYRDGSIEEKWKAQNAYNTIVGKRVDPALITMDGIGQYSLRIYPVPAKSSRKVTMTIQQPMEIKEGYALYSLPLSVKELVPKFKLNIDVSANDIPLAKDGLIKGYSFTGKPGRYHYDTTRSIWLNRALEFSLPIQLQQPQLCTKAVDSKNFFALRFLPGVSKQYDLHPKKLVVFWDVSASHGNRNIDKEVEFLEQYIERHQTEQLTITTFNFQTTSTITVQHACSNKRLWKRFLQELQYDGATQLGCIDLNSVTADVVLLFSDGWSTYGKNDPARGSTPVYAITTGISVNQQQLWSIVKRTGGEHIDLENTKMITAIDHASKANNILVRIRSVSGKTILDEMPGQDIDKPILLSGTTDPYGDTLEIFYGNSSTSSGVQKIFIGGRSSCSGATERMNMFIRFVKMQQQYDWNALIDFGLQEKIVTLNTAYIVLEKAEDYKKYNIAPPKDMREECERIQYVWKDTRLQRQQYQQQQRFTQMGSFTGYYNDKIRWWNGTAPSMQLTTGDMLFAAASTDLGFAGPTTVSNFAAGNATGYFAALDDVSSIDEVVMTVPYGVRKSLTYSSVSRSDFTWRASNNLSDAMTGRVAGLQVTGTGNDVQVILRGMNALGSDRQPLIVLDGMPTDRKLNDLNIHDIESVTILKDASTTAIYGSRGSNGVLLITSKRGRSLSTGDIRSQLSSQEDVDYMQEIKQAGVDKYQKYLELRSEVKRGAGFYCDMAQYLFETGYRTQAFTVLSNAAEVTNGDAATQRVIAFILDSWKEYSASIAIYEQLAAMEPYNYEHVSDLAWALYMDGKPQQAVNLLFQKVIDVNNNSYHYYNDMSKASLLEQMNAIINIHRPELKIDFIPSNMIHPLPVDLKIIIENNDGHLGQVEIGEPGGRKATEYWYNSKSNGRVFNNNYYRSGNRQYLIKQAIQGKYTVSAYHYNRNDGNKTPSYARLFIIKNYGRKEQEITLQNICLDNQAGWVEIGDVRVKK